MNKALYYAAVFNVSERTIHRFKKKVSMDEIEKIFNPDDYYRATDLIKIFGCSRSHVYKIIDAYDFEAVKIFGRVYIKKSSVQQILKEQIENSEY